MIDGEWLHSVCNMCEIHCGDKIKLPWTAKKGKIQYWNAVVVDDAGVECGDSAQSKSIVASDNTKFFKIQKDNQKSKEDKRLVSTIYCCVHYM